MVKNCKNKMKISNSDYMDERKKRLDKLNDYYLSILEKWKNNKDIYSQEWASIGNQLNSLSNEFNDKSSQTATPDELLESQESLKPQIVAFNNQLIKIAQQLLDDNKETSKGLVVQYQDLKKQDDELNKLLNEIEKLENKVSQNKNKKSTSQKQIENSNKQYQETKRNYHGLMIGNAILLLLLGFQSYTSNN